MTTKKEAEKALYNMWKYTSISDYKTKIKPQMDIVNSYFDRKCIWVNHDDFYQAECGFTFHFSDDRNHATDYHFYFCPQCGGKISEHERVER